MKLVIVETDGRGGLIHFAYQLAEAFAEIGVETTLVTAEDYELADLPHRARVAPILKLWPRVEAPPRGPLASLLRRTVRRGWRALILAREWARIVRFVRREKADVAVFSIIGFPWLAFYLRRLERSGVTLAQVCHEFVDRERGGGGVRPVRLPSRYAWFSSIFLLSEAARRDFCAAYPEEAGKTALIPHGPELLFEPEGADAAAIVAQFGLGTAERIVLMFGGLRPSKGVPELIEAFALLRDRPDTRLIVAGYPSREFDAEAQIARVETLGLSDRVTFDLRYLPMGELGALIRRADVVAFPYRSATSSGALALAQSLGRPVVATAVGGLLDAVRDGETGRLAAPGDPAALAAAIAATLDDPAAAEAMGARGRDVVTRERSWTAIARRMLDALPADRAVPATGEETARRLDEASRGRPGSVRDYVKC